MFCSRPLALVLAIASCSPNAERPFYETSVLVRKNKNLDLLFVIDNFASMKGEQAQLATSYRDFIGVLERAEDGLDDVHIGVVSSEVGDVVGCAGTADNGQLQVAPRIPDCTPPLDRYISDISDGIGGRVRNYKGTLADTFSCVANLGTDGCGHRAPLEAMRLAFEHPDNRGFRRDDATLAVVFITDGDDCSPSPAIENPNRALSPYECFEHGVRCEPDTPRAPGVKSRCKAREDSSLVAPLSRYTELFDGPITAMIPLGVYGRAPDFGDDLGAAEVIRRNGSLELAPTCVRDAIAPTPAVRLDQFLDAFHSSATSMCNVDQSDGVSRLVDKVGQPSLLFGCVPSEAALPLECIAELSTRDEEVLNLVPECATDAARGCFRILEPGPACETLKDDDHKLGVEYVLDGTEPLNSFMRLSCY